jgi:hypothetical protein
LPPLPPGRGGGGGGGGGGEGRGASEAARSKSGRRKRVLILMSDTGGGHRASAEALKAAFEAKFGAFSPRLAVSCSVGPVSTCSLFSYRSLGLSVLTSSLRRRHVPGLHRGPLVPPLALPRQQAAQEARGCAQSPRQASRLSPHSYNFLVKYGWLWRLNFELSSFPVVHHSIFNVVPSSLAHAHSSRGLCRSRSAPSRRSHSPRRSTSSSRTWLSPSIR